MSSSRFMRFNLILAFLIILMIIVAMIESQTKFVHRLYDEYVMDNKNHYLTCDQLPSVDEVTSIVEQHRDTIEQLEQINPGHAGVEVDSLIFVSWKSRYNYMVWRT